MLIESRPEKTLSQKLIQVTNEAQLTQFFEVGLIQLYQGVFADYPYFEKFTPEEVKQIFREYLSGGGLIFILMNNQELIGFAAGTYLENCSPGFFYIADLGVKKEHRRQGKGILLIQTLMSWAQEMYPNLTAFLLRTTIRNQPAINLYTKLGFSEIPNLYQEAVQTRQNGQLQSDTRIFFIKAT